MLQFIDGPPGSGKTTRLRQMVVAAYDTAPGGAMMLVPEQYSFETEKAILALAGPQKASCIQVVSFTRLAEQVFRQEGGVSGQYISDGGRRMLLRMAITSCEPQLEVYAQAAKRDRITDVMLAAISELKLCGITAAQLRMTGVHLEEGLRKKLHELSLIYDAYDALLATAYLDARDDLTRLAQCLDDSTFFSGRFVAVDAFEGFTAQEIAILVHIFRSAQDVCIGLCTDDLPEAGTGLFALVNRTKRQLKQLARKHSVGVRPDLHLDTPLRFRATALQTVAAQLFQETSAAPSTDHDGVFLYPAADRYEEVEFVAATIRNLVMDQGYRYRDFTIVCRNAAQYHDSLLLAMDKRKIPCFFSMPQHIEAEALLRLVRGALSVAQRNFQTEDLLELMKTGLCGFSTEQVAALENYVFLWRINGHQWTAPFTGHPRGFGVPFTPEDEATLLQLNTLRETLTGPLIRFSAKTKEGYGPTFAKEIYQLLTAYQVETHLQEYCDLLYANGDEHLAEKQVRIWDLLISLLDQVAGILNQVSLTRERFQTLLAEIIAGEDISEIPQHLDEVVFGSPEQVRQSQPKVVFLLGAVQGEFPLIPKSSGVFSDAERKTLIANALPFGDPLEQKTIEERYLTYAVACLPSERLYLSYPRSAEGEALEPSELVNALLRIFPDLSPLPKAGPALLANSLDAAFGLMAAQYRSNTPEATALRQLFTDLPAYGPRLSALDRAALRSPAAIKDTALAQSLYGKQMQLSATRIETYHSCKFKHFCQYGLQAKERRVAQVDALQYGTIMHALFEQAFTDPALSTLSETQLQEKIQALIVAYADENMGGFDALAGKERYRLRRMAQAACLLIRHVMEELSQSAFQPEAFELRLGDDQVPMLKIVTADGNTAWIGGTVDRVDSFRHEGQSYIRVVDYKTGKKEFRLTDVLHGLNMQMLVYLAALISTGKTLPAGILYTPLATPAVTIHRDASDTAIKAETDKTLRMSGLILEDQAIITAMEQDAAGTYIPASLSAKGEPRGATVSSDDMETVLLHTKTLIADMVDTLYRGKIDAAPAAQRGLACTYCPYAAICGEEYTEKQVQADKRTDNEALAIMRKEVKP